MVTGSRPYTSSDSKSSSAGGCIPETIITTADITAPQNIPGAVRGLITIDGEPVCCSSHLLVLIPSTEIGSECFAVSQKAASDSESARGFSNIEFSRIKGAYDTQRGLLLTVPYALYGGQGGQGKPGSVNVRVNLSDKGSVKIER